MSRIYFEGVGRQFAGDNWGVRDFSLEIADAEFVAFLGPSGCGKTTTLRILAGLDRNTHGRLSLDDQIVSDAATGIFQPPERRHLGMVFQSYAVWPHMNVFQNVAYPLKFQKMSSAQVRERVTEVLRMVELNGLEGRMPNQLSWGEQQRVALARGLAMRPRVLLLDEPLSNLDAKLREKMRRDIRAIQQQLKLTVVYVTHDQAEARQMSDRVVVMSGGRIEQVGPFAGILANPASAFVSNFLSAGR